jgi:hypothetical protein
VPIHRRLLAILRAMVRPKAETFFTAPASREFPNGDHHINPRTVNAQFQVLGSRCGFIVGRDKQGLTTQSLRRFCKTSCLDSGVPKPLVDRWLGHEDESDMDFFYYDPRRSHQWMERVPFGEPGENDLIPMRWNSNAEANANIPLEERAAAAPRGS